MTLRNYIEEKASEWVGYQRPAVDWMITEKGKPNSRLERTMHDFPKLAEVVRRIPRPLSRQDIFNCYEEDLYKGFVATLLWNRLRQDPFCVFHLFPFLVEPVENIRAKLKEIRDHLHQGDMNLSELFTACESPSQLQISEKVNSKIFTLALDHLSIENSNIAHPLMYNPRMRDVHCALLLEDVGTSQPFYNIEGDRVTIGDNSSEAECYEDYCERMGDFGLWAGSGNPEFLVDWMNYDEEGRMVYSLAKETIARFRRKMETDLSDLPIPYWSILSLSDFKEYGLPNTDNEDEYIAKIASDLILDDKESQNRFVQILKDNDLIANRTKYATYNSRNKGCYIENPFTVIVPWEGRFRFEEAISDYVILWSSPEETHRELKNVTMHHRGSKWIESLNYNVYHNGKRNMERYYFDLTHFFNQQ